MTLFCLEKLHRLPEELDVGMNAIERALTALDAFAEIQRRKTPR